MSRRHHGRSHRPNGGARLPNGPLTAAPGFAPRPRPEPRPEAVESPAPEATPAGPPRPPEPAPNGPVLPTSTTPAEPAPRPVNGDAQSHLAGGCTAPQLRRFIKSRPYVPMHELRRRFGINGSEDEVTAVEVASGRVFVGLPPREGHLLGELLRGGEIGYELSLDPRSPVVVGLYPMRPVPRV